MMHEKLNTCVGEEEGNEEVKYTIHLFKFNSEINEYTDTINC